LFVLFFALISGTFSGYFLRFGCRPAWLLLALTRALAVRPSSALCYSLLAAFFVVPFVCLLRLVAITAAGIGPAGILCSGLRVSTVGGSS
jgi:hypothetical protein